MSEFVKKDRSAYPKHALDGFPMSKQFNLVSARALMWLSQLAYETDEESKVDSILNDWQLTKLGFETNDPGTGLPPHSACVVVAEGQGATFVTFAGSDPLKFQDWITNFDAMPSPQNLHTGFEKAVETVLPHIQVALGKRAAPSQPRVLHWPQSGWRAHDPCRIADFTPAERPGNRGLHVRQSTQRRSRNSLTTMIRGLAISPSA